VQFKELTLDMGELTQDFGDIRKQKKGKENECRIWW
jgi:hypothetical protein